VSFHLWSPIEKNGFVPLDPLGFVSRRVFCLFHILRLRGNKQNKAHAEDVPGNRSWSPRCYAVSLTEWNAVKGSRQHSRVSLENAVAP
jgi:hypothetical protein